MANLDSMVSREYAVEAVSNIKDISWQHHIPNSQARRPRLRKRSSRVEALSDIATRIVAHNIEKYDQDYVNTIKPELVLRIWDHYDKSSGSFSGSLHAWKVFNMALKRLNVHDIESNGNPQSDPGESDTDEETIGLRRFYHHISFPTADFDVYTKPLQATGAFDFVSHIRIAGASPIRTEDLLLLPGLRNLGVLEIAEPGEGVAPRPLVSDRILRAWSEREDAFPRLLALRIAAAHDVTKECLQYAAKLPSLAVLQLHAGRGGWSGWGQNAAESGWLVHEGDDLFETGRSSTGTKACVDPRPSEHGGGGEWAYLACQLARSLPRPRPLGTRQNEVEHRAGGGSGLGVPFASLCLGEDRYTVERFMAPKVFLRRQPSVTGQDDGSASEMPRKAGRGRSENGGQTSKKRRVGPGRSAGGEQSTKKQRRAGIADLLSGFEG